MLFFRLTDSSLTTFGNDSTLPGNNSLNLSKGQANVCISHKYNPITLIICLITRSYKKDTDGLWMPGNTYLFWVEVGMFKLDYEKWKEAATWPNIDPIIKAKFRRVTLHSVVFIKRADIPFFLLKFLTRRIQPSF